MHDEVERIVSCTCSALCYILKLIYIGQKYQKDKEVPCLLSICKTRSHSLPDLVRITVKLLYIGHLYICHFKRRAIIKPRYLSRLECLFTNLKVVGSSPIVGKNFSFCIFVRFPRVPRMSTEPIHMKSSTTFIRAKRCTEKKIIWKKNGGSTSS